MLPGEGRRPTAKAERAAGELELVVTIPGGKVEPTEEGKGNIKVVKFPVMLSASKQAPFDKLVSNYFGAGASMFKPNGYEGISMVKAQAWADKGGQLHLPDAGIEGKLPWFLVLEVTANERVVTMKLREVSY